jgi:tetratricopeptide (TPR) repeat protein
LAPPPTTAASVDVAALLAEARGLLGGEPRLAEAKARQILAVAPNRLDAGMLLGAALRRAGDPGEAIKVLTPLSLAAPGAWGPRFELGAAFAAAGDTQAAVTHLRRATELNPKSSLALHALGDQLAILGEHRAAEEIQNRATSGFAGDPMLQAGAKALFAGDLATADRILKDRFDLHPTDVTAVRLLADAAVRMGEYGAAEVMLRPLLDSAPRFMPARSAYAIILLVRNDPQAALAHLEQLLAQAPDCALFRGLRGGARLQIGEYDGALADFSYALDRDPDQPRVWMSYGHVLRTIGRQADSVTAYRRSLALVPTLGEAYWSLANLKVVRFDAADLATMEAALAQDGLSDDDRAHLHFSLGKALEDERRFEASFGHYAQGNALRRAQWPHDWKANRDYVRRTTETFTEAFLAAREGVGDPAPDPIFVVGLPRSGSTLIEQILSSHSRVEGVSELPDLIAIASRLGAGADPAAADPSARAPGLHYPAMLADLPFETFAALGAEFLERTRIHRKLGRPFFIDKLPNNFMQLGLIHLILPNAKIIDARRDPMACCFSGFKQNFARGAQYSYSLEDLGRYYRDYLTLMAHFDAVLPGRVHRVLYEDLVRDPEPEIRRLLAYCGLDFEPGCLRFHETARPVRTASSEQVRRPLFTEGLDHWCHFEPWLGPLSAHLA